MADYVSMEFKGKQLGVKLAPRGENDPHVSVYLLCEDDGHWFETTRFSSYWIEDMIEQLQRAKQALALLPRDESGYGRVFPENK